ncbi:RelE_StbE, addiction module toxin, RelE/StbE family [Candidatus Nanopelagicaceae bacterium]
MKVILSPSFKRTVKQLHSNQKRALDDAIQSIQSDPLIGSPKKGDLSGVYVLKFKISKLDWLLAYQILEEEIILLLVVGPHENFYRDLKR